jgi:hypothetical protein
MCSTIDLYLSGGRLITCGVKVSGCFAFCCSLEPSATLPLQKLHNTNINLTHANLLTPAGSTGGAKAPYNSPRQSNRTPHLAEPQPAQTYPSVQIIIKLIRRQRMLLDRIISRILRARKSASRLSIEAYIPTHRVREDLKIRRRFRHMFAAIHIRLEHIIVHSSLSRIPPLHPSIAKARANVKT